MTRFSHTDPRYKAALREMAKRFRKLLDERGWTQADLVRAGAQHMPLEPGSSRRGRYAADSVSNWLKGKRKPTRAMLHATMAALGVSEEELLPDFLRDDIGGEAIQKEPILTAVPGRPGYYRIAIDEELPLKHALAIVKAHGEGGGENGNPDGGANAS